MPGVLLFNLERPSILDNSEQIFCFRDAKQMEGFRPPYTFYRQ
ncbi:hypothetical protein A6R68_07947 [Acetobacter orientalis]|uniref:Uncharacterized protein n=1 Tax=Acetobacter orientalis TaxID=146474 RepID=A0A2Z5ZLL3_9PROT|nr:hypothetical protein A6R68_07947 [Acetobacter orientalis]